MNASVSTPAPGGLIAQVRRIVEMAGERLGKVLPEFTDRITTLKPPADAETLLVKALEGAKGVKKDRISALLRSFGYASNYELVSLVMADRFAIP